MTTEKIIEIVTEVVEANRRLPLRNSETAWVNVGRSHVNVGIIDGGQLYSYTDDPFLSENDPGLVKGLAHLKRMGVRS